MPKDKSSLGNLVNSWLTKVPNQKQHFKVEGSKVFCVPCGKLYSWDRASQLTQHVATSQHSDHVRIREQSGLRQTLVGETRKSEFSEDLCKVFLAADIPFKKLKHPQVAAFFEKWCQKKIPDESTLRKNYVKPIYMDVIERVRQEIDCGPIYLQIDETTDATGRYVANVIVGRLSKEGVTLPHLLMVKELEFTNNSTITQLVLDSLSFLWPGTHHADLSKRFLVLLTDMAPYMVLAGKNLKNIYPKLLHVTCLAHALNRVAESVRSSYKQTDKLISNIKAIFKKSASRVRKYKELCPNLPLPPEPVIVRWGTWLRSVEFLATNFEAVKNVVMQFDSSEAESVRSAQHLLQKDQIAGQLAEIHANYVVLAELIQKLEIRDLSIGQSFELLDELQTKLNNSISSTKEAVLAKRSSVLSKNPDLEKMKMVSFVLRGESNEIASQYSPSEIASLKFCPLTSVEVERSFSMAKAMLPDNRQRFAFDNFEMQSICHYEFSIASHDQ